MSRLDDLSRRHLAKWFARSCLGVGVLPMLDSVTAAGVPGRSNRRPARNLIYLYMSGGMTHLDTFNPKPGVEEQGPIESIETNVAGIALGQHLSRLARHVDKLAIINSMQTTTGAHEQGRYYMRTGYPMRGSITHPGIGSWLLRMQGAKHSTLPGYVVIGGSSGDATAGFMEMRFAPVPLGSAAGGLPYSRRRVSADAFIDRLELADAFDRPFRRFYQQKQVRAYTDLYKEAIALMDSKELSAFDISKEPPRMRELYGQHPFGQGCLLARRLVEHDVRCIEVNLGGWDTHNDHFDQLDSLGPVLDQGFAALISDLSDRRLLDSTLVVLATEFGRTPRINVNRGRDHHPAAFSCVLAGGGIRGGQVYGASDARGYAIADAPVSIPDFNATIGQAMGLDLDQVVKSGSGRPFTFAGKGKPIADLF